MKPFIYSANIIFKFNIILFNNKQQIVLKMLWGTTLNLHNCTTNTYSLVIAHVIVISANGDGTSGNVSRSMPSSPGDKNRQPQPSIPVVGSAENLVGRVSLLLHHNIFVLLKMVKLEKV